MDSAVEKAEKLINKALDLPPGTKAVITQIDGGNSYQFALHGQCRSDDAGVNQMYLGPSDLLSGNIKRLNAVMQKSDRPLNGDMEWHKHWSRQTAVPTRQGGYTDGFEDQYMLKEQISSGDLTKFSQQVARASIAVLLEKLLGEGVEIYLDEESQNYTVKTSGIEGYQLLENLKMALMRHGQRTGVIEHTVEEIEEKKPLWIGVPKPFDTIIRRISASEHSRASEMEVDTIGEVELAGISDVNKLIEAIRTVAPEGVPDSIDGLAAELAGRAVTD